MLDVSFLWLLIRWRLVEELAKEPISGPARGATLDDPDFAVVSLLKFPFLFHLCDLPIDEVRIYHDVTS